MNKKTKGILAMAFLCVTSFMIFSTEHLGSLGDYVLEFVGLRSWSIDGQRGVHFTFYYFCTLSIFAIFLVSKYTVKGLHIKKGKVALIYLGLLMVFYACTNLAAITVKKYSAGSLSITYKTENSKFSYDSKGAEITRFDANIFMENYSKEDKEFYMTITCLPEDDGGERELTLYNLDGSKKLVKAQGNSTKTVQVNIDDFDKKELNGILRSHIERNNGMGSITGITLTDKRGTVVRLDKNHFFGVAGGITSTQLLTTEVKTIDMMQIDIGKEFSDAKLKEPNPTSVK